MAYITIEDSSGSMEMLVFQKVLNEWTGKLLEGTPIIAKGRISVRDEKEPQLLCDSISLLGAADPLLLRQRKTQLHKSRRSR
jgi:DNA polymerase-3 subunit alpha